MARLETSDIEGFDFAAFERNAVQHLAKLREEGIVAFRRDSQTIWYRIDDPRTEQVLATLHRLFCRPLPKSRKGKS